MKIGMFIKNFAIGKEFSKNGIPTKSGAEFHCENHALQLIEHGDSVYIMTKKKYFFTKGREILNGIDLCRLHAPFRWLESIIRLITTHRNTDCFYIIGTPHFAVWAILYARIFNKPTTLVITIKEEVFEKQLNWRNKILASCTNYIAISQEIKDELIRKTEVKSSQVHILPQGVDSNRFIVVNKQVKRELRKKYKLPEDKPIVLFCARLVLRKGVDTMLKAWEIIHKNNQEAILIIVGGGENHLIDQIKAVSQKLGNSIILFGEVQKPDEYYQLSDLYFFPSRMEGLPTTMMEAMASGVPCVASDIGGCRDLIAPSEAGVLVEAEDYNTFAKEILNFIDNDFLRKESAAKGRQYVESNLDCYKLLPKLRNILQNKL